jgi:hypothetical protein
MVCAGRALPMASITARPRANGAHEGFAFVGSPSETSLLLLETALTLRAGYVNNDRAANMTVRLAVTQAVTAGGHYRFRNGTAFAPPHRERTVRTVRDRLLERREAAQGLGRDHPGRTAQDHPLPADAGGDPQVLPSRWATCTRCTSTRRTRSLALRRADRAALDPHPADVLLHADRRLDALPAPSTPASPGATTSRRAPATPSRCRRARSTSS